MFAFEYDHSNYKELLQEVAKQLNVPFVNGRFFFPRTLAIGFMQLVELQNNLQAAVFDQTYTNSFYGKRKKSSHEFYTLWFNEITTTSNVTLEIDNDKYQSNGIPFSSAMLTSSRFDAVMDVSAGTRFKGITILLDNQWLATYLGLNGQSDLLKKYLSLKASRITMEPIDIEYKKLIDEIIQLAIGNEQFKKIAVQNRVMLLIERFFKRMAAKIQTSTDDIKLSREDISRVMEVEALLTQDVFQPSPFISELAKMVHVSESKLKNDFKTVYGLPIYKYFQKARMIVAKDVLKNNKYSIKQIAQEMGYSNFSNFSIAFKKQFGTLPSELQ